MDCIRILLADDHAGVRTLVRDRLMRESCLQIVGEAENSAQALAKALALKPDIVLIDPMMRDGLGIEVTRQITTCLPRTAVIVLTAFADTAQAIELRKAGTRYILNKGIESRYLVDVLTEMGRGESAGG